MFIRKILKKQVHGKLSLNRFNIKMNGIRKNLFFSSLLTKYLCMNTCIIIIIYESFFFSSIDPTATKSPKYFLVVQRFL